MLGHQWLPEPASESVSLSATVTAPPGRWWAGGLATVIR